MQSLDEMNDHAVTCGLADELSHAARNWDAIDELASRQAQALEFFEEELEIERPLPLFQRRQHIPITKNCRYAMAASLRVNAKLASATVPQLVQWEVAPRMEITTAEDRAARRIARAQRQAVLNKLREHPAEYVPFREGMRLAGLSQRTLHKGTQRGLVRRSVISGQICVNVADLHRFATSRKCCWRSSLNT